MIRQKSKKWIYASVLLLIFGVQLWAAINFLIVGHEKIEDLYFSTDDPYSNYYNSDDPTSIPTFYKTDSFNINFRYSGHVKENGAVRSYYVTIRNSSGEVIYTQVFQPNIPGEVNINLTNIVIDPTKFTEIGTYLVDVAIIETLAGWVRITAQMTRSINIAKEILDVAAWYTDEIYLETSSDPYHHNIQIFGRIEEAGENHFPSGQLVDIYWREPGGQYDFIKTANTSQLGFITHNITRYNTLSQDQMKLRLIVHENDIYSEASNELKTPLWSGSENVRHIIKNAGQASSSLLDAYTEGAPLAIEISNKDHYIYSPNGNNSDIEDYTFATDPFLVPNTFGFTPLDESRFDGYDYRLMVQGTEVPNNYNYTASTPTNFNFGQNIIPSSISTTAGVIDLDYVPEDLRDREGVGPLIQFQDVTTSSGESIPSIKVMLIFLSQNLPHEQFTKVILNLSMGFNDTQQVQNLLVSYQANNGQEQFLMIENDVLITDYSYQFNLPISKLDFDKPIIISLLLQNPTNKCLSMVLDKSTLDFIISDKAHRLISWDKNLEAIDFGIYGGCADSDTSDPSNIQFGTEVKIPAIPYHSLKGTTATVTFSIDIFENSEDLVDSNWDFNIFLFKSNDSASILNWTYPLADSLTVEFSGQRFSQFLNFQASLPPANEDTLFYLVFYLDACNLTRGEQIIVHLEEIVINALFERIDSSVSMIESYHDDLQTQELKYLPDNVTYEDVTVPYSTSQEINAVVPNYEGSNNYPFNTLNQTVISSSPSNTFAQNYTTTSGGTDDLIVTGSLSAMEQVDLSRFNVQYPMQRNFEYVTKNSSTSIGREFTLAESVIDCEDYSFKLGVNRKAIISIPINHEYGGIQRCLLNIQIFNNISGWGQYNISYRRVQTPLSWTPADLVANYYSLPEGSLMYLGNQKNLNPYEITNTSNSDNYLSLDITQDFLKAIASEETFITYLFNASVSNATSILKTGDISYWKALNSEYTFSTNYLRIDALIPGDLTLEFYDPSFLITSQTMTINYLAINTTIDIYSIYENGTSVFLDTLTNNSVYSQISIPLILGIQYINDKFSLVFRARFLKTGIIQSSPTFSIDYLALTHYLCNSTYIARIPSVAETPYYLNLSIHNLTSDIDYTTITFENITGDIYQLWSYEDVTEVSLSTPILASWGIVHGNWIDFYVNIIFLSQNYSNITLSQFSISVANAPFLYKDPKGWNSSLTLDFQTTLEFDSLQIDWNDNGDGYLLIKYGWASSPSSPISYSTWNTINKGTNNLAVMSSSNTHAIGRILFIEYQLVVSPPFEEALLGPILNRIRLNATRYVFASKEDLCFYDDGLEAEFGVQGGSNYEFFVNITLDSNRRAEPILFMSADYFDYPAIGAYATLFLDAYNVSLWNIHTSTWMNLSLEKRIENTIDAKVITEINDLMDANGTVRIRYWYAANHYVNVHIDYVGIAYYADISNLLNITYYHHIDLNRASQVYDVFPNTVSQTMINLGTNISSNQYTSQSTINDPSTGDPRGITLVRTLNEFASGNVANNPTNSGFASNSIGVIRARSGYRGGSYESGVTGSPDERIWGSNIWYVPVPDISESGYYTVEISLHTSMRRHVNYEFAWTRRSYSDTIDCSTFTSFSSSTPQSSSNGWTTSGDHSLSGTIYLTPGGSVPVYIWGKYYIEWWEWLLYDRKTSMTISPGSFNIKVAKNQPVFEVQQSLTVDIPIKMPNELMSRESLRGVLLMGSFNWNGYDINSYFSYYPVPSENVARQSYSIKLANNQTWGINPDVWEQLPFSGQKPSKVVDSVLSNHIGDHPDDYQIPYDGRTGSFLPTNYIIDDGSGTLKIRLNIQVKYARTSFNAARFSVPWWWYAYYSMSAQLNMGLWISASNLRAVPLLADGAFIDWGQMNYLDFGAVFEFDVNDLQTSEYNITSDNAWYFATHLKYSIHTCWTDNLAYFTSFRPGATLSYKVGISIAKQAVNPQEYTWISINPDKFNLYKPLTLESASQDYEVVLVESEDRASLYDPNALRLGTTDIKKYFIDGNRILFKVNITIRIDSVETVDYQKSAVWGSNAPRKQFKVTFESYTTIDSLKYIEKKNNLFVLHEDISLPTPANTELIGKMVYAKLGIGGQIALLSAELCHFEVDGIGLRLGTVSNEGGYEILSEYSLKSEPQVTFEDVIFVPYSKFKDMSTLRLIIEIGYWNGRFAGVYDDIGVLAVKLDYLQIDFLYSTGFFDKDCGKAYVDRSIDISLGYPVSNNITSIIVSGEIDSVIQGVEVHGSQVINKVSFVQPNMKIYNWMSKSYDSMAVFALGGNSFQFVVDSAIASPLNYINEGRIRLLAILDGRMQLDSSFFGDAKYYARMNIISLECELAEFNTYPEPGTNQRFSPAGDQIFSDEWPSIAMTLRFRREIILEKLPSQFPVIIEDIFNFDGDNSQGLFPYEVAVIGNAGSLSASVEALTFGKNNLIISARMKILVLNRSDLFTLTGGFPGVRIYWMDTSVGFTFTNATINGQLYSYKISQGPICSNTGYLPFIGIPSTELPSIFNLDFSAYSFNSVTSAISRNFLFNLGDAMYYSPLNVTSFEVHLVVTSEQELSGQIGIWEIVNSKFVYYPIPTFTATEIYFITPYTRYYILPFEPSDFNQYYSEDGRMLVQFCIQASVANSSLNASINLLELKLIYNEETESFANKTYLKYIADEDFLNSLSFFDNFDDPALNARYIGNLQDFSVINGQLTKIPRYKYPNFHCPASWWIPRYAPSYILVNKSNNLDNYYARFNFNIQETGGRYDSVSWMVRAQLYNHPWFEPQVTGIFFRLQAYESGSHNYNQLEIWERSYVHGAWHLSDLVALPSLVHVNTWYDITTRVNGSIIELWLNGTKFYSNSFTALPFRGYFGFYSYYPHEYLVDNVILSDSYVTGGSWGDYFAQINVQMPAGNELRYGDAINVTLAPIPEYTGSLTGQKINLMVNSSDGWLFLDEKLTDSVGQGSFAIDNVDLYTKDLLGNAYERKETFELLSNNTIYYAQDSFEGLYEESWTSNNYLDFSVSNNYLIKTGSHPDDYFLTSPPGLPINYTFTFQAQLNEHFQREQLDWVLDSDSNFRNAWGYTLYSSRNVWYPNTLQLYKVVNDQTILIDEVTIAPEIFINQWHYIEFAVSEYESNITHSLYINNQLAYQRTFTSEEYGLRRTYLGFVMNDREVVQIDNFSVYSGSEQWTQITYDPFIENVNTTSSQYENVLYNIDGITRLDNVKIITSPYSLIGNNTISMQLNMSFPDILNEFGEPLHLTEYYGVRVGVLIPYDEIVQKVTVYILDPQGNRHDVVLEGSQLNALYKNPNSRALFINGSRLLHTFIDVGLKNTWSGNLDTLKILGIECARKSYTQGEYKGLHAANQIGIASLHLLRQLNNYSYNNYGFGSEPESEIAIWYQGEGVFYSSLKIIPHAYFRRIPTTLTLEDSPNNYSTNFGGELSVSVNLSYGTGSLVPLLSLIIPAAFVLLVDQRGKKVIGGYEVVNGQLYNLRSYDNYSFNIRTFIDAGNYPGSSIMWFGNGLFTNSSCLLPIPLEIYAAPTSIDLITDNFAFDYGYPVSFDGIVFDNQHEMLKDQSGLTFNEDFEGILHSSMLNNTNINPIIGPNCSFAGEFDDYDSFVIQSNNLQDQGMEVPFINMFKFRYWTNTSNLDFLISIGYQFSNMAPVTRTRVIQPSATNSWIDVMMNTEFDDWEIPSQAIGQPIILYSKIQVTSRGLQNACIAIDDIEFAHDPLVYLQVRGSDKDEWHNLTASTVDMQKNSESGFKLPLFTKGKQFLLNNIYEFKENTPTLNGFLESGDYQVRIWYPGCSRYYQETFSQSFIRINPIETAIFYVPDQFEGPTRDGFYEARKYNSTTVFAREVNKPFTLLDIGYTWGDTKNLTFILSEKQGGFNGIPNKPVWFQVGIVPASQYGLQDRDYFADYYPVVRNIATGSLIEQPFVIQDKYGRPVIYDYYDYDSKSVQFYGPYLWMVAFTDDEGYVTFPLDFAPDIMDDLYEVFPSVALNNVDKDLYIRVFYDNAFSWIEKAMPIQDSETEVPFVCTASEHARDPTHIFDRDDVALWEAQYGSRYQDRIYTSSYAEGILDCRQEDLKVTGENFEVTNKGDAHDFIPLLVYVSEYSTLKNGSTVDENLVLNEYNHFDLITAHFFIIDPISNTIMLGDKNTAFVNDHPDMATGRVYIELNSTKITSLVPGYYDVYVYIPESEYYQSVTTTFRMLLKSQYTYEFTSPTTLVDFNYEMDQRAAPFFYNITSNRFEDTYLQDSVYPKLKGSVWLAADPTPTITSDGVGVSITLNNYPIFDQVLFPVDGAVPFEISLEYFVGTTLNLNFSTWTDEELIGRDMEFPYSGTNQADWVRFNASIFVPTFTDPVLGTPAFDIIARFNELVQEGKVTHANVFTGSDPRAVKVNVSSPIGQTNPVPSLLIFPTGTGPIPSSVNIELPYQAVISSLAYLNTNGDSTDGEEYLDGFVINGSAFNTGIRHAYVVHPLAQSTDNIVGAISMNATSYWQGMNFPDVYCPFEGYFETIIYAPEMPSGEAVEFQVLLNAGMEHPIELAAATITGPGRRVVHMNGTLEPEYYSTINNVTLRIRKTAGSSNVPVFWIGANLTGFEDLLYVSNRLPYGRAALFSSNFLYYYVQSAADIGYDPETNPNKVWFRVENSPGNPSSSVPHYDLASNILKIYQVASAIQMGTAAGRDALAKGSLMDYTFVGDRGIFIRNQFFNLDAISAPEVHAGYYSMYGHDAAGNPNYAQLLGRRKVTIVANPYSWTTNPGSISLLWNNPNARFTTSLGTTPFETNAAKTIARLYYAQEPNAEDRVFEDWDYYHFQDHWNRTGVEGIGFDFWYNKMVYTGAVFQQGTTPQHNLLDFYPATKNNYENWANYDEVVINLGVNNSFLVENFKIKVFTSGDTLLTEQNFPVVSNESMNYFLNLDGITLNNVARVELWCLPNQSRLIGSPEEVFFSSEGIALSEQSKGVSFNVTYDDGSSTITSIPRSYFGDYSPFEVDLQPTGVFKPIENISLIGYAGSKIDLSQVSILQYEEDPTINPNTQPVLVNDFNFDANTQRMENIQRFLNNKSPMEGLWHQINCVGGSDLIVGNSFNPYVKLHYFDYNFDGIYDIVERYEDHDKQGFANGIGDFYSIDAQNDGVFEKSIYRNVIIQTQPVGDDPTDLITQYKKTEQVTDVITNAMGTFTVVTEDTTFQTKQAGSWLPEVRTRMQSISMEQNPRPIYIFEDIDEWRVATGDEDYEIHKISTWNETSGSYDIEEWHDWAVTLRVRFLGEEEEEMIVTGILDRGVTRVKMDPAAPISPQDVNGTILWFNSHLAGESLAPFYDTGLVLLQESWSYSYEFNAGSHVSTITPDVDVVLCIGIILDLNRDHRWQQERPGTGSGEADSYQADIYAPIWELNPLGRYIIRQMAQDEAWRNWQETNSKAETIVNMIVSIVVSVVITMAVTAVFTAFLGPLGTIVGGFLGSLIASLVMQYLISPFLSYVFDPEGFEKNERIKNNQNLLLNTRVPAPPNYAREVNPSGLVTPNSVYNHYEATYQGYQVALQGVFVETPSGKGLQVESGKPPLTIINAKFWVFDQEAPEFLDGGDIFSIIWGFVQNPFGLIKAGDSALMAAQDPAGYRAMRYTSYKDQRAALIDAYEELLAFPEDVHVVIYPTRRGGSPMFIAVKDDVRRTGISNFWNFSNPVIELADRSMVVYAAKYQNYMSTDWRSALASIAVMVVQMIAQMGLTKLGTKFVTSHSKAFSGGKASVKPGAKLQNSVWGRLANSGFLKELAEEIFVEEFLIHSLGGFIEDQIQLSFESLGWDNPDSWLLPGWSLGDWIEWGFAAFSSSKSFVEQSMRLEVSTEVDSKPTGTGNAETQTELDSKSPTKADQDTKLPEITKKIARKIQGSKLFTDVKIRIEAETQLNLKKQFEQYMIDKVMSSEFNKRRFVFDYQIRREVRNMVKQVMGDSELQLGTFLKNLQQRLTVEKPLLQPGIRFDAELTFNDGGEPVRLSEYGIKGDPKRLIDLTTPLRQILSRSDIKSINFIDPSNLPDPTLPLSEISRKTHNPPKYFMAKEITDINTADKVKHRIGIGTEISDIKIIDYISELLYGGKKIGTKIVVDSNLQQSLYQLGIERAGELAWVVKHEVSGLILQQMLLGGRNVQYFIELETELKDIVGLKGDLSKFPNSLPPEAQKKLKTFFEKVGQSLVEAYGAQRIMTDYVNDLKNAITHEKLISKRGNPDIIGILKLAGVPYVADGKFYYSADFVSKVLKNSEMGIEFRKYMDGLQADFKKQTGGGGYPKSFTYYTLEGNVDNVQQRLKDPSKRTELLNGMSKAFGLSDLKVKQLAQNTATDLVILQGTYNKQTVEIAIGSAGSMDVIAAAIADVFSQMYRKSTSLKNINAVDQSSILTFLNS